jgi:adenylate cyclase
MRWTRWTDRLIGLVLLAALIALRLADPGPVRDLRLATFDVYQQAQPAEYVPQPVRIIALDDQSLAAQGQWPWPRTTIAQMIARLARMGAAVVAFDVIFAEPDRTAPAQLRAQWQTLGIDDDTLSTLDQLPDPDAVLVDMMGQMPVVTGFAPIPSADGNLPRQTPGFAYAGSGPIGIVPRFAGAVVNLDPIEQAAFGNGALSVTAAGTGGTIRRVPLLLDVGGQVYPSLALETLRVAFGASTIVTRASDASGEVTGGARPSLLALRVGPMEVPLTANGQFWVHYTDTVPQRYVPAWQILAEGAMDDPALRDRIAGHIVLVGATAAGLADLRATPLNPFEPGVAIHARVIEQILSNDFLERPDWAPGAELLLILVLGLVLVFVLPALGAAWSALIALITLVAAAIGSWLAYTEAGLLFDPLYPAMTTVVLYGVLALFTYLRTDRERAQVRQSFSRYLAPALVDQLAKDPGRLRLGGETKTVTILFADIAGFTGLSETMDAGQLTHFLNRFLTPMTGVILDQSGTVDKYMGDAIMAFWNAPLDVPDHEARATRAAMLMQARLAELNAQWRDEAEAEGRIHPPIGLRIGLNTGSASVGNMGSEQRFDYSVLGDTVNLASRLEGQCKTYGITIMLGEETAAALPSWALIELDLIRVKGRQAPARIFTPLGDERVAQRAEVRALIDAHDRMIAAYRARDWSAAEQALAEAADRAKAADIALSDLYVLYEQRLTAFKANPPPADWDGVYIATSK